MSDAKAKPSKSGALSAAAETSATLVVPAPQGPPQKTPAAGSTTFKRSSLRKSDLSRSMAGVRCSVEEEKPSSSSTSTVRPTSNYVLESSHSRSTTSTPRSVSRQAAPAPAPQPAEEEAEVDTKYLDMMADYYLGGK
ncbi:hypothetical protein HDU67_005001 [Dinochytrium kinnereticum]|nr:hypothetical protein HDU67_005001 [Dinochytrium kinnereticum]